MSLIIPEISKEELLKQTLEKFKTFLVRDLKIDEQRLDSVEGLYENINLLKRVKPFIAMIGQGNVTEYVSDKLIAHFSLKEINSD